MSGVKLSVYFGERDRAGDRFLADALCDIFAAHRLSTSLVMRGTTGFGAKQHLRTDRLLTLSEDLPLVAVGVDAPERVERGAARRAGAGVRRPRHARARGRRAAARQRRRPSSPSTWARREPYDAVVAALHRHGVAGATVLLGVDGTAHGERRRARFLGRNAGVPLMVVSVGEAAALAAALPEIAGLLERPIVTWERVRVCKRDGVTLDTPEPAEGDAWQKIMVYGRPPALPRARALAARHRRGGRDDAARRLGLPRRSHPARRERLAAAAERAGG